jgi:uncharacterized protein YbaR (Trm112 family)
MSSWIEILACPFCKLGMDELQARAMEVSIYFLLVLIYTLIAVIVYKIARMMAREERDLALSQSVDSSVDAGEGVPGPLAGQPKAKG